MTTYLIHLNHDCTCCTSNYLEIYHKRIVGDHLRLCMDNIVAVSYVHKQGGKITALNDLTNELWLWCIRRKSELVQNIFKVQQTL